MTRFQCKSSLLSNEIYFDPISVNHLKYYLYEKKTSIAKLLFKGRAVAIKIVNVFGILYFEVFSTDNRFYRKVDAISNCQFHFLKNSVFSSHLNKF